MVRDPFSKCHPAVNFLFFLGAIGFGVVILHPAYILAGCVCALCYLLLLKGSVALKSALFLVPLFLLISFINPLFNYRGTTVLFMILGKPYTLESLYHGMAIAGIFLVMMLWFLCYNEVLTSDKFICLFGSRIPALSMVLVMILRLIPNLIRKASQLSGARKSIGRGTGEGSTRKEKLRDGMLILSGLTDWALEGSIITADSMRSRGYGTAKRTSFHRYRLTMRDCLLLFVMVILVIMILVGGTFDASYTPEIIIPSPGWGLGAYFLFLLIPTMLYGKEAFQWHISMSKI